MIGKKVFLRPLELNDVQTLYVFENDVEVWAVSDTVMPYSSFALEQYVMEATRTDIYDFNHRFFSKSVYLLGR